MTHAPTPDETRDDRLTTRRRCLTSIAAGATLLAGCLSADGDDSASPDGVSDGDLPEFSVDEDAQPTPMVLDAATLVDPGSIEFLDEFAVELAIANVGGAAITDLSMTVGLEYVDGSDNPLMETLNEPDPVEVTLPEIDSGDWETVEAAVRVNAEGDWELATDAREHPEFHHEVEVGPARLAPGESVASDVGGFEFTSLEPRYDRSLHYDTEEGGVGLFNQEATGVLAGDSTEVLLIHRFAVENTNDDRSVGFGSVVADNQFANAVVEATPGDVVTSDDMRDDLDTLAVTDADEPFGNNVVDPGETAEIAVVQLVDESSLAEASLTFSFTGDGDDIVFETGDDVPSIPSFELVDASIENASDEEPTIELTVENDGDAAGTFRGGAQFHASRPTASDWVYLSEGVEATLDVGERETLEVEATRGDDRFRVLPFETELER
ncbi:hypothetical protein [Natrarchaeobius oligotrophus]|uniref:DUF4352 domain-containing protein n=1 Tax=Natrarchaeobius chitinivorans TaxID=1679083 RepID=A0A3N6PM17_NATCH|nr:hypothetical protein [Natrarchaeobius chitinivorans]RQH00086.1 hypothetical protein EA472_12825 [Natrarchaeobius chitinivorans]